MDTSTSLLTTRKSGLHSRSTLAEISALFAPYIDDYQLTIMSARILSTFGSNRKSTSEGSPLTWSLLKLLLAFSTRQSVMGMSTSRRVRGEKLPRSLSVIDCSDIFRLKVLLSRTSQKRS